MLLIIVPIMIYLKKMDKTQLQKYVIAGSVSGTFLSMALGALIFNEIHTLDFAVQDFFEGGSMLFIAFLILITMVLMKKQAKQLDLNKPEEMKINSSAFGLFVIAFITIFRESLEIVIFNLPFFTSSAISILAGSVLGILLAIVVMYLVYKTTLKLKVNTIFNIITVVLICMGSLMFGEGLAGVIPSLGSSIEKAGMLLYFIPTFLLFLKSTLKQYVK